MAWWKPRTWFKKETAGGAASGGRPDAQSKPLPEIGELLAGIPDGPVGDALKKAIDQAEKAYDDLYEGRGSKTAYYSDMKESLYDAIRHARELGLDEKVEQLERLLEHRKAVFRSQMA